MTLPDIDYSDLNPGIRLVVKLLRGWGYNTIDSGDGVTHEFECDRPYPYVVIKVPPTVGVEAAADKLSWRLWNCLGVEIGPQGSGSPSIQATYDPADQTAFIDLMDFDDAALSAAMEAKWS